MRRFACLAFCLTLAAASVAHADPHGMGYPMSYGHCQACQPCQPCQPHHCHHFKPGQHLASGAHSLFGGCARLFHAICDAKEAAHERMAERKEQLHEAMSPLHAVCDRIHEAKENCFAHEPAPLFPHKGALFHKLRHGHCHHCQ